MSFKISYLPIGLVVTSEHGIIKYSLPEKLFAVIEHDKVENISSFVNVWFFKIKSNVISGLGQSCHTIQALETSIHRVNFSQDIHLKWISKIWNELVGFKITKFTNFQFRKAKHLTKCSNIFSVLYLKEIFRLHNLKEIFNCIIE